MKKIILFALLVLSLGIAGYQFYTAWRLQDPEFQRERTLGAVRMLETPDESREAINIDELAQARPQKAGTREIVPMRPIMFDASVKEAPQIIDTSYLTEAFGVLRLNPAPTVSHRMFVETAKGRIIPVYVWDEVAPSFPAGAEPQRMVGYHVYTYSKGPAIIVDGVI